MLLYAEHTTTRLRYILDFISTELFTENITITSNLSTFLESQEPKISYSVQPVADDAFHICPVSLLAEEGIRPQDISFFEFGKHKAFFRTAGRDFPFDIFSASFYLLSRYEEYLFAAVIDEEFRYEESLACKNEFLDVPLINCWLKELKTALKQKYPGVFFTYRPFKFIPTYNIDKAYAYTNGGWRRNMMKDLRMVLKGEFAEIRDRKAVFNGKKSDPFDAYEWLDALHLYCRLKPHFFFLLENDSKTGSIHSPASKSLQQLIRYYAASYKVGVHLSAATVEQPALISEEIELLGYFAGRTTIHSRLSPLRGRPSLFFRSLIERGIEKDHSMGYTRSNGFRASVASSFFWYDLELEKPTTLLLFPFCFSDTTAYFEQRLTAPQAFRELMHFYNSIKAVNGLMITTWHNHFLGNDSRFNGWKDVYEIFLKDEVYWD